MTSFFTRCLQRDWRLAPTDEDSDGFSLIAAVYQGHLTMEVVNVVLQTLPSFHLDCEKVVVVPLEFSPRSKLAVKCMVTSWKCSVEKEVVVGVDCHLVLVLAEMKE